MQRSRQAILDILEQHGQVTVIQLSNMLDLTPVTVRYHLKILLGARLVCAQNYRHQKSPGRPEHVFSLAEEVGDGFSKNGGESSHAGLAEVRGCTTPVKSETLIKDLMEHIFSQLLTLAQIVSSQDIDADRLGAIERRLAYDIWCLRNE